MGERAEQGEALWYVGPGRVEIRTRIAGAARRRRGAPERALRGDQPGHRAPGARRPYSRERAFAHARAQHGGRVSVSGEIRLRDRRPRRTPGRPICVGRIGFALHPHQTAFNLPVDAVALLPPHVPASRGVLAANMETALNAVWDAAPGPADRIAIVGGGVVGSLCAWLCAKFPGADVTLVDVDPRRAEIAAALGVAFALPVRCGRRLRRRHPCQRHRCRARDGAAALPATRRRSSS